MFDDQLERLDKDKDLIASLLYEGRHKEVHFKKIADRLGVSRRTLFRLIKRLTETGKVARPQRPPTKQEKERQRKREERRRQYEADKEERRIAGEMLRAAFKRKQEARLNKKP